MADIIHAIINAIGPEFYSIILAAVGGIIVGFSRVLARWGRKLQGKKDGE